MKDDDKKWLYIAGAGLLLTVILMNLKPKPTKKPPSLLGDGTDDGTDDGNPPVTQPPVTQPPNQDFPNTMPNDKALLFQKNLEFFLRCHRISGQRAKQKGSLPLAKHWILAVVSEANEIFFTIGMLSW